MPSVFLRPATEHDIAFLADVSIVATRSAGRLPAEFDEPAWREGFGEWTHEQVQGLVEHSTTYVVEIDGESAGRLRVVRAPDHLELAGLQLLPAHQGQGIGTHLVEQLLVEARDTGLQMRLSVDVDNPRARALYSRLGFVATGETDAEVHMEWRGA